MKISIFPYKLAQDPLLPWKIFPLFGAPPPILFKSASPRGGRPGGATCPVKGSQADGSGQGYFADLWREIPKI